MRAYARAPPPLRPAITSGRPHLLPCARHQRSVPGARGAGHVALAASDPGRGTRRAVEGAPWPEYVDRRDVVPKVERGPPKRRGTGGARSKSSKVEPVRLPASEFADSLLAPSAPGLGLVPLRIITQSYQYIMPAAALPLVGVSEDYRGPLAAALVVFDGADACIERRLFDVRIDSRDVAKPVTPTGVGPRVDVHGMRPLARLGGVRLVDGRAPIDAYHYIIASFTAVNTASDAVKAALPTGADVIIGMQRLSPRQAILSPTSVIRGGTEFRHARAAPRVFHGPYRSPPPAGSDRHIPTGHQGAFDAGNHVLVGAKPWNVGLRSDYWPFDTRFGVPTNATNSVPFLARFVAQVSYETVAVLDLIDMCRVNCSLDCLDVSGMAIVLTKIHDALPGLGAHPGGGIDSLCLVFSSPADVLNDARNDVPAKLVANVDVVVRVGFLDAFTPPAPPDGVGAADVGALLAAHGITAADLDQALRRFHYVVAIAAPVQGRLPPKIRTTRVFRDVAPGEGTMVRYTMKGNQFAGKERIVQARDTLFVAVRADGNHEEWLARMTLCEFRKDSNDAMHWYGGADDEVLAARSDGLQRSAQWSGNMAFNKALAYLGVRSSGRTMHAPPFGPGGTVCCFYSLAPDGMPVIFVRKAQPGEVALWGTLAPTGRWFHKKIPLEGLSTSSGNE